VAVSTTDAEMYTAWGGRDDRRPVAAYAGGGTLRVVGVYQPVDQQAPSWFGRGPIVELGGPVLAGILVPPGGGSSQPQGAPQRSAGARVGDRDLPGVLLADETTSQVDHRSRDEVIEAIRTVNARTGMTVLLITHDPDVAAALPRTITIRDGPVDQEEHCWPPASPWRTSSSRTTIW
jgi:hypothetical protein